MSNSKKEGVATPAKKHDANINAREGHPVSDYTAPSSLSEPGGLLYKIRCRNGQAASKHGARYVFGGGQR